MKEILKPSFALCSLYQNTLLYAKHDHIVDSTSEKVHVLLVFILLQIYFD